MPQLPLLYLLGFVSKSPSRSATHHRLTLINQKGLQKLKNIF